VDEVTVRRQQVALQQPRDCGAMQPPQGLSGIMHWLERDPFILETHDSVVWAKLYARGGGGYLRALGVVAAIDAKGVVWVVWTGERGPARGWWQPFERAVAGDVRVLRASRGGRRARARASTDSVRARFVSKLIARARASTDSVRARFVSKLIGWRVYNISRYDALLFNWAVQNRLGRHRLAAACPQSNHRKVEGSSSSPRRVLEGSGRGGRN
jgi:hypothetical protein